MEKIYFERLQNLVDKINTVLEIQQRFNAKITVETVDQSGTIEITISKDDGYKTLRKTIVFDLFDVDINFEFIKVDRQILDLNNAFIKFDEL